jgi:hypothetical protein
MAVKKERALFVQRCLSDYLLPDRISAFCHGSSHAGTVTQSAYLEGRYGNN